MADQKVTGVLDSGQTVAAGIALCVVGASGFLLLPLFIGAAAEDLQLVESRLGILAGVMMAAAAISSLLAIFLVRKFDWIRLSTGTVAVMLIGNISALLLQDNFILFLGAVVLIGLGGSATYSLALTILSDNSKPDRIFGYSIATQVSFQVLGLLLLPSLIESGGLDAMLIFLIVMDLIGLAVVKLLPHSGKAQVINKPFAVFVQSKVLYALAGCFFFFFNVGCFWAFIERMGNAAGYAPQIIGNSLAVGVAVGIAGSLAASSQGDRHGRLQPLLIATVGTVITAVLLTLSSHLAVYILAVGIYNFAWNYSLAYQYAVVSAVDGSGRGIAVVPAFHALGGGVGPALAGLVISANDFSALNILVALSVMISFLFFIPAAKR